jgi:hypothetical protein
MTMTSGTTPVGMSLWGMTTSVEARGSSSRSCQRRCRLCSKSIGSTFIWLIYVVIGLILAGPVALLALIILK